MELRAYLALSALWSRDEELCNRKYFGRRLGVIVILISLSSVEICVNQLMAFHKLQRSGAASMQYVKSTQGQHSLHIGEDL
jgi:hypothetical protein